MRRTRSRCVGLTALLTVLGLCSVSSAATITVDQLSDDFGTPGGCSLREAIQAANTDAAFGGCTAGSGADTIVLGLGTHSLSLDGGQDDANQTGDLDVLSALEIVGAGIGRTIIKQDTSDRVISQPSGSASWGLRDLTVTGGRSDGFSEEGAGVHAAPTASGATVTLTRVRVTDNGMVGLLPLGGGVYISNASLSMVDCIIDNNFIEPNAIGDGAGVYLTSVTGTIARSTIRDNEARDTGSGNNGGGVFATGAFSTPTDVRLIHSTISGNTSENGNGGGAYIEGYARLVFDGCTVTDNDADAGGAGSFGGVVSNSDPAHVSVLWNTAVVNNIASVAADVGGSATWEVGWVAYTSTNITTYVNTGPSTIVGDGALAPLADNGGHTLTHRPDAGSPLVDLGTCSDYLGAAYDLDQRGVPRGAIGPCDVGSVEREAWRVSATSVTDESPGANCALGGKLVATGTDWNGNGVLDAAEAGESFYVCNTGSGALVMISNEPPAGGNCSAGGQKVETGLDNGDGGGTAGNGQLEAGEIDQTVYVCNGSDGSNGTSGADGFDSLVALTSEPGGANCENGGIAIAVGLDDGTPSGTADNGVLEPGEIDATEYVCHGADGESGNDGENGNDGASSLMDANPLAAGSECASGGVTIDVGLDNGDGGGTPGNGVLESGEIDHTIVVCNGADGTDGEDGSGGCSAGGRSGSVWLLLGFGLIALRRRRSPNR